MERERKQTERYGTGRKKRQLSLYSTKGTIDVKSYQINKKLKVKDRHREIRERREKDGKGSRITEKEREMESKRNKIRKEGKKETPEKNGVSMIYKRMRYGVRRGQLS